MTIFTFPGVQISTAGLATETEQQAQTALLTTIDTDTGSISTSAASIDGKTPALGQALAAASVPVVLTAAQVSTLTPQTDALTDAQLRAAPVPVSGPLTDTELRATPVPVSGPLTDVELRATAVPVSASSLPLPADAATETTLAALNAKVTAVNTGAVTISAALPAGANVIGAVTQSGTWTVQPGNTANTTAWLTQEEKSSTATLANISGATSSTTLQASNSARKGWSIHNDSSAILYVKFGSTASSTSYTVKLIADAYYELPTTSVYTGIITGIWASATGSARVTELT